MMDKKEIIHKLVTEAETIFKKYKKYKDNPYFDVSPEAATNTQNEFIRNIKVEHDVFYKAYYFVINFMLIDGKFDSKAFKRFLNWHNQNPFAKSEELIPKYKRCMIGHKDNIDKKKVTEYEDKISKKIIKEREKYKKDMDELEKKVEEDKKELLEKKKKLLLDLCKNK